MATKSLQRSRKELEKRGFSTWIVEKPYNPWSKKREDLFNCIDLVGIREDIQGTLGIQACGEDVGSHVQKLVGLQPNPYLPIWLKVGNRFFIWSWRLRTHKGTKDTWQLREIQFILKDGQVIAEEIPKGESNEAISPTDH